MKRALPALVASLAAVLWSPAAFAQDAFTPESEPANAAKQKERYQYDVGTPQFMAAQGALGLREQAARAQLASSDPERNPEAQACGPIRQYGCLGDPFIWDWELEGHGVKRPFLFTARNGATLSAHMWATKAGPARRPAIVMITGSIQVPEPDYWFAAVTWAKRGYVVLTFDVQGQGISDTYGEGGDRNEGVPSQAGGPFYDGGEDALDFLFSTPAKPYKPRKSCSTGTDHSPKQTRRVTAKLNAAYNPLWEMVDPERVGIAGQSLGASAASFVGQGDPRVDAIVGMDNLSKPNAAPPACAKAPETRKAAPITKPGIGISNDYFLTPEPRTEAPDPQSKNGPSKAFSEAGVDSVQVNVRGGTHAECAFVSMAFPGATLRGVDFCSWYAAAWFDKYLKGDPTADQRILTSRWRNDPRDKEIDAAGKGNLFSYTFRSRVDIHRFDGERVVCEDVRVGCPDLVADDGEPPSFDYRKLALTPDGKAARSPDTGGGTTGPSASAAASAGSPLNTRQVKLTAPVVASDTASTPQFGLRVTLKPGASRPIARFQLEAQVAPAGAWRRLSSRLALTGRYRFAGRYGRAYRFRARAVDGSSFAGPWAYASTVVPFDGIFRGIASRSGSTYTGAWRRIVSGVSWGRTLSVTDAPGASFSTRLRGTRLYVIGRRSDDGASAQLTVDGRVRNITFRGAKSRNRAVIARLSLKRGLHSIRLTHAGPADSVVRLDGLAIAP